jgi:hypothetical protein
MMPPATLAVMVGLLVLGVSLACSSKMASPGPTGDVPGSARPAPTAGAPTGVTLEIRPIESPRPVESPSPPVIAAASPAPGRTEALVALAVADAAQRTGIAAAEVVVQRVESREWPDRSLGCPRPGVGYAQVITPGYMIVVQARGQELEYHTDQGQVIACAR